MVDLQGRTLIPGFVDPHSHIGGVGLQAISANLLPPPDGPNASIAQLQKTLRQYIQTSPEVKQLGMVFGFGYDDSQLKERRRNFVRRIESVERIQNAAGGLDERLAEIRAQEQELRLLNERLQELTALLTSQEPIPPAVPGAPRGELRAA